MILFKLFEPRDPGEPEAEARTWPAMHIRPF